MIAGHLVLNDLYERKLNDDGQRYRERDCETSEDKTQAYLQDIDVLSGFRQDSDGEVDLTSDQKVGGSWPSGCIKNLNKIPLSKSQITSKPGRYSTVYTIEDKKRAEDFTPQPQKYTKESTRSIVTPIGGLSGNSKI